MVQGPPLVVGTLQGVTTPLSTPLMAKKLRTTSLEEALLNAAAAGKHKLDAVGELSKYSGRGQPGTDKARLFPQYGGSSAN